MQADQSDLRPDTMPVSLPVPVPLALPLRDDTFLGVCQALGDDFGFSPNWLRIAFGAAVLWNPLGAIVGYLTLGLVVAFARLVAPPARVVPAAPLAVADAPPKAAAADALVEAEPVALAA